MVKIPQYQRRMDTHDSKIGVGVTGDLSSFRPPPETHQPQTPGKRSRKQRDPQRDSAAAGRTLRDEEQPLGALVPSAALGLARLPLGRYRDEEEEEDEDEEEVEVIGRGHGDFISSRFKGVTWDRRKNKWTARGKAQRKDVHIGYYDKEEDAARAHLDYVEHGTLPARKVPTPAFTGVSWHETRKGWRAQISKNGKKTNLGVFDTQQDAALVYNAAVTRLGCPASWLYDIAHAGCAGNDELHNSEGVPACKKSVVAVRAKPPHRLPPTGTHAVGTSKTPPPAAVGGPAAQHLTPFVVQHEADTMHSKARMVTPGVAGLAREAGVTSWAPCTPRRWPDTFKTVRACRIASCTEICDKAYTARSRVCLQHMQARILTST